MGHSLNGTGDHWDPYVRENKPAIAAEQTWHAEEVFGRIREDLSHVIPCAYRGEDHEHPEAMKAIHAWTLMRAQEAVETLADLAIDDRGMLGVKRVVKCHIQDLRPELGLFWTTDIWHGGILGAPWGPKDVDGEPRIPELLVSANVHQDDVDWQTSCLTRMDWYSGDDEKELRLLPGRPLHDVRVEIWDQSLNRNRLVAFVIPQAKWTTT